MGVKATRSSVMGFIKETTEGELKELAVGSDFVPLREGFSFEGAIENITSDELINGDFGAAKSFITKETPTASFPKYIKHSGVEGQAPSYGLLIESAMGSAVVNSTEYAVAAGSDAGSASATAKLAMTGDQEDTFAIGQAVLIKDGTNGYSIRNIKKIDSTGGKLELNYNLSNAPAFGVKLGKCVAYKGATSHPTFSAHRFQAITDSAFKSAMAGCRTTSMSFEFPALEFATGSFEFAGIEFFMNHIRIGAANRYIDFKDDAGSTLVAILEQKVYGSAHELAEEIAAKMTAASAPSQGDAISCTYSDTAGNFTITSAGDYFGILWNSGTNKANSVAATIGFSDAADNSGGLTYVAETAQKYDVGANGADAGTAITPSYDDSDNLVMKGAELFIGDHLENLCRKATTASFSITTPKTDALSLCADNGIDSSVILSREVTFSATLLLQQHEVGLFHKYKNDKNVPIMFNAGPKVANNWSAGKCVNIFFANSSITSKVVGDSDGYQVVNIEAKGYVGADSSDVYINFI